MLTGLSPRSRWSRLRRGTTGAALAAFAVASAGVLVSAPAVADGPTTFTNSAAITIATDTPAPPTPATPYPSTITVSGMAGPVSDVDVRLNGFSHGFANDVDLLLVGPSGANLVLLSDPGGPNGFVGANNATVTFDDSAMASVPQSGTISGTVSYRPTDTDAGEPGADSFPAPAPAPGSATTLATFTGTNPNGTWRLYVVDDATGDSGSIAGGWSVTITTSAVAASTTTVLNSSPNPSTTGTSVTFTATVTSGAAPVTTGTVTFAEGPTTLAANVPVNASGQATFSTSALAEGSHVITATFNGTPTLLTSSGTVTQVVNNATTHPDGDTWCNAGGIAVPSSGTGTPYPSRITVSGAGTAISLLTVDLADVAHTTPFDLEVLVVGPTGQNLVLMSDVGGSTAATGVDLTFADSASGPIPAAGPLSTGTFDPSDDDSNGADAALPPPAPVASSATTLATFNGTNPNGTWSLFVADDASGDSGSIAGGWCLNVSTAQPTTTVLTSSVNPSTVGQSVTYTATVTSGGNPVTTGTVNFTEGATTLASGVALNASGQATFTTSTLTEGSHTITATYTGTAAFQPSSGSVTQVVQRAATSTVLTSSVNPSTVGQSVTFTATVTSGGNPVTTGTVDFTEGATILASGVALNASGQATFTTSTLTEGSHTITATYSGTAAFQPSSGSVTQVVQSACTITGTTGNDFLTGTPGPDIICGLGGNDYMRGAGGNDILRGHSGDDILVPDVGNETVDGGAGADTVNYVAVTTGGVTINLVTGTANSSAGSDTLIGIERATGTQFVDTITGNDADNILAGLGGADTITAAAGNDRIYPGNADDPVIDGGAGSDTVDYTGTPAAVTIDLPAGTATGGYGTDTLTSIENAKGSSHNDVLIAITAGSTLEGNAGDDRLRGAAGNDALDGGTNSLGGGDICIGNGGTDVIINCEDTTNAAPTATDQTVTTPEDTALPITLAGTDPDGDPLTFTYTQPTAGTVTGTAPNVTYTPTANTCGPDSFTFTASDWNGASDTATVSITVTCGDDPPVAVDDSAIVAEDAAATAITVLANDTDADAGPKAISAATDPANGTVVLTGGTPGAATGLTYQPDPNYCNTQPGGTADTFTYTLTPGGDTGLVSVTVTCVDDPPVAVDDAATVVEDAAATAITVLANDTDIDAGPRAISAASDPANGTVVLTGGSPGAATGLTYQPDPNYCNSPPGTTLDTFTYTLTPGGDTGLVSVTVTCGDDPPVAVDDTAIVVEDAGATAVSVLTNDTDIDAGPRAISAASDPANGTVVLTGGTPGAATGLTYQPDPNYCNTPPGTTLDTFTYTLTPGGDTGLVSITVTCVDDPPVAVDDSATVVEDAAATAITVLANDTDIDAGPRAISAATDPANGTVVLTGGTPGAATGLTYQPDPNYCNTQPGGTADTFTYTLTPGGDSGLVSITVTCGDDPPVAVDDTAIVAEDAGATAVSVLTNDTDIDAGPRAIASASDPANGTVALTGGTPGAATGLTYQPDPNYCNTPPGTTLDTFTYTLTPGGDTGLVSVTVTCVDDPPVAVDDSATVVEDAAATAITVLANDTDIDAGPRAIASASDPANGTVALTGGTPGAATGLTYQPDPNYCNTPPGTILDTFTYTLTPGGDTGLVSITVTCVDDPPVAVDDSATVVEDAAATAITVLTNDTDIDAGPKAISAASDPANGTVALTGGTPGAATGLTYQPDPNYCNTQAGGTADTFTYTLTPGGDTGLVSITVTCVNDAPTAGADSFDTIGNTELRVDLAAVTTPAVTETTGSANGVRGNDTDPVENNPVTVTSIVGCADIVAPYDCTVAGGTVSMTADGDFSFIPSPTLASGAPTDTTFQYVITDQPSVGAAATATGTVTIHVYDKVWYVRQGATGNGTSTSPLGSFTGIAAGDGTDSDAPGDYIFVHNSGPLSSSIVLEANQHLLGEGVGLSINRNLNANGAPVNLVAAGTAPTVTSAVNTISVTQAVPMEIRGLTIASTGGGGNAIDLTATGAFSGSGSLTIANNTFAGAIAETVDVNGGATGTLALTVGPNTWSGTHAGNGIDSQTTVAGGAINLALTNNSSISTTSGTSSAILVNQVAGAITITDFSGNGIPGSHVGTGVSITNARFDQTPGGGYQAVNGGALTIGASGNGVGAAGLVFTNVSGDLSFTDLDVFADNGAALSIDGSNAAGVGVNTAAGTGTRVVLAGTPTLASAGGPVVNVSDTTITMPISSATVTSSPTTGISLSNVVDGTTTATFAVTSGAISGTTGHAFNLIGSNVTVTYGGTITNTVAAARSVNVTGNGGNDTISFTGAISGTGNSGILLDNNDQLTGVSTISFSGGLTLNGTNSTFTATNGGTVNVTGTNTIGATTVPTGPALNVANTTIGASGLVFQRISATGGANGIVLNTTGASGGLTVTGIGTTGGSGGTIQNTTGRGANVISSRSVTLTNMNFTNAGTSDLDADNSGLSTGDNLATNAAIHLQSVSGATLDRIVVSGGAEQGINGNAVSNFVLSNSSITNVGNAADEDNIHFFNMSGTSSIINTTLTHTSGGGDDNLNLQTQSGTLTLTISGGSAVGAAGGVNQLGSGYLFGIRGTTNATITFNGASSTGNFSGGIVADAFDSSIMNLTVTNSTSSGNNDQLSVSAGDTSNVDLTATSNTLSSVATGDFVVVGLLGSAFDTGYVFDARITGNTITVANGLSADGVIINNAGGGTINASVTGNTLDYAGTQRAIIAQAGQDGNGNTNLTVTGNPIDIKLDGTGNAVTGIFAQTAVTSGNTSAICADIGGAGALSNTFTHSLGGTIAGGDIRVRQRFDGTMRLPGYAGGATDLTAVVNFLNGRNTEISSATATADSSGYAGGDACPLPTP